MPQPWVTRLQTGPPGHLGGEQDGGRNTSVLEGGQIPSISCSHAALGCSQGNLMRYLLRKLRRGVKGFSSVKLQLRADETRGGLGMERRSAQTPAGCCHAPHRPTGPSGSRPARPHAPSTAPRGHLLCCRSFSNRAANTKHRNRSWFLRELRGQHDRLLLKKKTLPPPLCPPMAPGSQRLPEGPLCPAPAALCLDRAQTQL